MMLIYYLILKDVARLAITDWTVSFRAPTQTAVTVIYKGEPARAVNTDIKVITVNYVYVF